MESTDSSTECSSGESSNKKKTNVCPFENCNSAFFGKKKLRNHILKHTGERPFACNVLGCTKTYTNSSHLRRHNKVMHENGNEQVRCPVENCRLWISNPSNLKKHMKRMHNPEREYRFKCKECNEGFHKKPLLQKHSYVHTGILPFKCDMCDKKFITKYSCARHKRTHTNYVCECGYVVERWSELLAHKKKCTKSGLKCTICEKQLKSSSSLSQHMKIHQNIEERDVFLCKYEDCERFYCYKKNLDIHIKAFHENQSKKSLPCPREGCKVVLSSNKNLKQHLQHHDKPKEPISARRRRKDKDCPKVCSVSRILSIPLSKDLNDKIIAGDVIESRNVEPFMNNKTLIC